MRPVLLELNGFASFREAAAVDFADADFFALVGPTGSGKSTVIDAMTFALYGSVPRWGRKGMVSLALAPTVGRGTVKLVFDVGGRRYVVARELRRVGAGVSQKAASLERLADPQGRALPGDPTEVLATDLAGVTETVERLLGLRYDDFCHCVVLPQGQFANFLHAPASVRQEILLRLLSAEHYKQMMNKANQRAAAAGQRAISFEETLAGLADATPAAQAAVRDAELTLARLSGRVTAALPGLQAAADGLALARATEERLAGERAALAALRVPGDVAELDSGLTAGRAAVTGAAAGERAAEEADRAARAALAGGPQRAPLELARQRRAEHGAAAARLPGLEAEAARLTEGAGQAEREAGRAADGLEARRRELDLAARAAETAAGRLAELRAAHGRLSEVWVPDKVEQLDESRQAAAAGVRGAAQALHDAEQAEAGARQARAAAVAEAPLAQALRDLTETAELSARLVPARAALARARAERAAAEAALHAAEAGRDRCQQEADAARRAHVAADLRPHLAAGQPCPVCEQPVGVLPPPLRAAAVDEAAGRVRAATRALSAAAEALRGAVAADSRCGADADGLERQLGQRRGALGAALDGPLAAAATTAGYLAGGVADPAAAVAELTGLLRARRELDAGAEAAALAVAARREDLRAAQAHLDGAESQMSAARDALRAARDVLVPLGAPAVDDSALAAAWAQLAGWAAQQAAARQAELEQAGPAAREAAGAREQAQAAAVAADREQGRLRTAATRAATTAQQARTRHEGLAGRVAELAGLLDGAPAEAAVTEQLALRDRLEAATADAERRLLGAREERAGAERALAGLERAQAAARARLSAARDEVVRLGAPALDGAGLLDGWTALAAWAAGAASERARELHAAAGQVGAARAEAGRRAGELSAELADAGIRLAPETVAAEAAAAVAAALERARAATERIAERIEQAVGLTARRDAARAEQQVARMLGDLLRSDRFPRWLVTAAIDALVAEASATLAGLSGGQFDLSYDDGEFYVIDHADADSRRSVRTLSGGETFQASLALALALSAQMSGLAAAGGARLDSIFLDEGFGTLDPETLEVVSATLETLAQGQRMVGVITHVAALAERVPVRFLVSRDARSSRVVRESPA